MFKLVLGNVGLGGGVEAADDVGGNNIAGFGPRKEVFR